jgi:hypothetical protein
MRIRKSVQVRLRSTVKKGSVTVFTILDFGTKLQYLGYVPVPMHIPVHTSTYRTVRYGILLAC